VYVTLEAVQTLKLTIRHALTALWLVSMLAGTAHAQTYSAPQARRNFVTLSYDFLYTQPLHFGEHPIQDLVGRPVVGARFQQFDYRTRDELINIDVLEFTKRSRGAGITVYPFGVSNGPALGVRGSFEDLPTIRVAFEGDGAPPGFAFESGRAYDLGVGLYMADRAPGWGLGSHAFVVGGFGRVQSDNRDGRRYFAEGGGGLSVGPIGVELSVKFAWNRFTDPVEHTFMTIPLSLRGTVTF
jgi:hypothetical protein